MKLENVVPLGRSLDEYKKMFDLSDLDFDKNIVGVGDGPASVNAELKELGKKYLSVDPVYIFSADEIENKFHQVVDNIFEQIEASPNSWVWSYHENPQALKNTRINVTTKFVADFEQGLQDGRYVSGELPNLHFKDDQFSLALCSHFLFLYSDLFSYEFHLKSVLEMLRIAGEVRIFPLLTLDVNKSDYVNPLIKELENQGYAVTVKKVNYEFQKGGNEMLSVSRG